MNTKQLSKQLGTPFRLRPQPIRVDSNGNRLSTGDDQWRLDDVLEGPARLRLTNLCTNQSILLEWDNIIERRSPDFLLLRCQLLVGPESVAIEPIHRGTPIQPAPETTVHPQAFALAPDGNYVYKVRALGFEDAKGEFTSQLIQLGAHTIASVRTPHDGWTQLEFLYTGPRPPEHFVSLGMKHGMKVETQAHPINNCE